jgi:hypothetical protein
VSDSQQCDGVAHALRDADGLLFPVSTQCAPSGTFDRNQPGECRSALSGGTTDQQRASLGVRYPDRIHPFQSRENMELLRRPGSGTLHQHRYGPVPRRAHRSQERVLAAGGDCEGGVLEALLRVGCTEPIAGVRVPDHDAIKA